MWLNGSARHVPSIRVVSAEFICENFVIETNAIDAAFRSGVEKFLPLGSSRIHPRLTELLSQYTLFTGPMEPTNEPYATAKIVGIKLRKSYSRRYNKSLGVLPKNHANAGTGRALGFRSWPKWTKMLSITNVKASMIQPKSTAAR